MSQKELPEDVRGLLDQFDLKDVIDPFAFDLLDLVEKGVAVDPTRFDSIHPVPRTETEWIQHISRLTVVEFGQLIG